MIGFESLIKIAPILAVVGMGCIGYGEIRSDIANLQDLQVRQYDQVMSQLNRLQDQIDTKADK